MQSPSIACTQLKKLPRDATDVTHHNINTHGKAPEGGRVALSPLQAGWGGGGVHVPLVHPSSTTFTISVISIDVCVCTLILNGNQSLICRRITTITVQAKLSTSTSRNIVIDRV